MRKLILVLIVMYYSSAAMANTNFCSYYPHIKLGAKLDEVKKAMSKKVLLTENRGKTYQWISTDGVVFKLSFYADGKFAEAAEVSMVNLLPHEEEFVNLYQSNKLEYKQAEELMGPGKQIGNFYTYEFSEHTGLALFTDLNNVIQNKISNVC